MDLFGLGQILYSKVILQNQDVLGKKACNGDFGLSRDEKYTYTKYLNKLSQLLEIYKKKMYNFVIFFKFIFLNLNKFNYVLFGTILDGKVYEFVFKKSTNLYFFTFLNLKNFNFVLLNIILDEKLRIHTILRFVVRKSKNLI